jgi:predicted enzyme related to lactoylglutathione lyase
MKRTQTYVKESAMSAGIKTIIFPVKDVAAAKGLFTELVGAEPYADMPYYVGYRIGDQEIGLDPNGHKTGMTGPIGYWEVDDIEGTIQTVVDHGGHTVQGPRDVGGGKLIARVEDADGNVIGLAQTPPTPQTP